MLRNLKLWQKLGLLSLAFVIPTLVLVVLLRQERTSPSTSPRRRARATITLAA